MRQLVSQNRDIVCVDEVGVPVPAIGPCRRAAVLHGSKLAVIAKQLLVDTGKSRSVLGYEQLARVRAE